MDIVARSFAALNAPSPENANDSGAPGKVMRKSSAKRLLCSSALADAACASCSGVSGSEVTDVLPPQAASAPTAATRPSSARRRRTAIPRNVGPLTSRLVPRSGDP